MQPILFRIPLHSLVPALPDVPVYGYGLMLFFAFVLCTWLACYLAWRQGIPREVIQDLAVWVFLSGIIGARITFMIQYSDQFSSPLQFFAVWDGGLVFYGSFLGGAVGLWLAYRKVLRPRGVRFWPTADVIAPCAALGLCLGRVGCLLNGCCYGNVACPDCPAITFPLAAAPRFDMTRRGYQTAAGFTMSDRTLDGRVVGRVEEGSPAWQAGLRPGDVIVKAMGRQVESYGDLVEAVVRHWPKGEQQLSLTVRRNGEELALPPFGHRSLGLHPTQVYESVSMGLLLLLLLAYFPLRSAPGRVMALFMVCYAVHRFLNETLRTDTDPVAFGLTLSQNLSILILVAGIILWIRLRPTATLPAAGPPSATRSEAPEPAAAG